MSEPTCTESAPCFACARCVRTMANVLRDDPNVRAHMTGVETRPAWKPAWKHAAEAGETLPTADGAYTVGSLPTERTISLTAAFVAALPTGERVELPAGTVLREGTDGIDPTKLLQRIKDLQDDRARQHAEIERLRAQIETSATPADRAVGAAMLGSLR